jgi:hypothetical protein
MAKKDQYEYQDEPAAEPAGDDDPRHVARAEELARQQEVVDAVAAWNANPVQPETPADEPTA